MQNVKSQYLHLVQVYFTSGAQNDRLLLVHMR